MEELGCGKQSPLQLASLNSNLWPVVSGTKQVRIEGLRRQWALWRHRG